MLDLRQKFIEYRIKELKESTDFVNSLLKCITGYAILVGDFDGNIIVFNEGAHQIFGYVAQDVVGIKNIEDFYPPDFVKAGHVNELFDRLIQKGEYSYELTRQRKNGDSFPGQSLLTLVQDDEKRLVGFVEITEDITERKIKENALIAVNQKLIEFSQFKDSLLSIASHELRTPLTSIKSFVEILLYAEEDRPTQVEFLNIINKETDRLIRIINDFLDMSKMESGRMQWQPAELSLLEIVHQVVNSTQPLIEQNKLNLSIKLDPDLPPVLCDKDRLIQVVTNLLGNAIKFTPENGRITISSRLKINPEGNSDRNIAIVGISDTGIGIAPQNFDKIFETFGQVGETLKDRPKGTGLGLPICKKIIEHFGGRIWVESQLGVGSTFFFSLPVMETAGMAREATRVEVEIGR
jgi:PAS domain S-box-containing protein